MTVSLDKVPTGTSLYLSVVGRRVSANNEYWGRVTVNPAGQVAASLLSVRAGTQTTVLGSVVVPGVTYTPGLQLKMRFQVTGTSPTTLRLKVWPASGTEPATWLRSTTDAGAGLQAAGAVGLTAYVSGAVTNAPIVVRMDD